MFSPDKADDLQKMLIGLWESLVRGGDDLGSDCATVPLDGVTRVAFKLRSIPADKTRRHMVQYVRAYAAEAGWRVSAVTVKNHRLEFSCELAEPGRARRRSAEPARSDR